MGDYNLLMLVIVQKSLRDMRGDVRKVRNRGKHLFSKVHKQEVIDYVVSIAENVQRSLLAILLTSDYKQRDED